MIEKPAVFIIASMEWLITIKQKGDENSRKIFKNLFKIIPGDMSQRTQMKEERGFVGII